MTIDRLLFLGLYLNIVYYQTPGFIGQKIQIAIGIAKNKIQSTLAKLSSDSRVHNARLMAQCMPISINMEYHIISDQLL